jgi:hypothetical protein
MFSCAEPPSGEQMPANHPPYRLQLFTLRLWQEVLDSEEWEWRGEVKNTSTGELRYFREWHALVHLLPTLLAELPGSEIPDEQDPLD